MDSNEYLEQCDHCDRITVHSDSLCLNCFTPLEMRMNVEQEQNQKKINFGEFLKMFVGIKPFPRKY